MPTYEFENSSGERIEQFHPMSSAPRSVVINGETYERIISAPSACQISMGPLGIQDKYPYTSNALPPDLDGCQTIRENGRRKPLIESARHEREVAKRNGLVKT